MSESVDLWAKLRKATRARIALGRAGDGLPTRRLLEFQMAHAMARDAVHGEVDWVALSNSLQPRECVHVRSAAADRATYLRRPDLGRMMHRDCVDQLSKLQSDMAFVIADGLSADAVQAHAVPVLEAILDHLNPTRPPTVVTASQARVALGDHIGSVLGARIVVVLIGERPGLSSADSLGIYITYDPAPGRRDNERNCISNIHSHGLTHDEAGSQAAWLVTEALKRRYTGVLLKPEGAPLIPPSGDQASIAVDRSGT